ncbi:hypothetical protein QQS21_002070 [Conoideocrella luteorostrata]|uniref:Uncharacterized protein n=1 Tax=Conoideocrella luteorostrata TaxID=1105319 RepID=A0AAJ0CVX7_9HYPO|nr:hypothetical protein QQS21_002070 [Conoideocrella luteorostrata]
MVRFTALLLTFVASSMALAASDKPKNQQDASNDAREWLKTLIDAAKELQMVAEEAHKEIEKAPDGQKPGPENEPKP